MTRRRLLTISYSLGALLLVIGFLTAAKEVEKPDTKSKEAPVTSTATPTKKLVCLGYADTEDPIVRIFPDNFPQPCKVTKVLAFEGDHVKAGQPLLELDDRIPKLRIQEAASGMAAADQEKAKAQATFDGHEPQVNSANFELSAKEEELKTKKSELAEIQRLFNLMNKNKADLEAAESAVKAAEFMLESARWKLKGLRDLNPKFLVLLAEAGIKRSQALHEQAKLASEQFSCKAPADGIIIRSFSSDGMIFGPHSREPAFWFIKSTPLIVRCEVNQEFARRIAKGMQGKIEDDADPSQSWKGKVIRVSDHYLSKRSGGGSGSEIMQISDDRVLECLVSIELAPKEKAPRYGQKLKVSFSD